MKKQCDFPTIIFLLTLPLFLFLNVTQAKAQCNIVWWGDESGSVPTTETSVTETATYEAFFAIFWATPNFCGEATEIDGYFCMTSSLTVPTPTMRVVSLDQKCWSDSIFNIITICEATGEFGGDGEWDVVCSDPCEASGGDSDFDDICDDEDNCPDIANSGQEDADNDGIGDACDDDGIALNDYDLCIWDFSGPYTEIRDGMTLNFTLIQDAKGKVTGSGNFNDLSDGNDISIPVEIKGNVKGKKGIVTLKYKVKGKNADGNMLKDDVSLELKDCILPLTGTEKRKICQKGGGCEKTETNFSLDVPEEMTGETVLLIDATPDEKGKKHKGTGELVLSNGDIYNLNTKGKYNSNQEETQYQIKGVGASTKGIKFKLKIDEESDNATFIRGKALGQQLKY